MGKISIVDGGLGGKVLAVKLFRISTGVMTPTRYRGDRKGEISFKK
jgi:hypothetical protein